MVIGKYWAAQLSNGLPRVGDKVFLYGAEPEQFPSFSTFEGWIVRLGTGKAGIRAYSTLPFRNTYCGAPVLNESKVVIGMVAGRTTAGETEVILARYITHLMKTAGLN